MKKQFATATKPRQPPAPIVKVSAAKPAQPPVPDAMVKGFFRIMKTTAPGFIEQALDQYPALLEYKGSPSGGTPVVYAAELGKLDIVKLLHRRNANLLASDNGDQGALFYAAHKGHPDVAEYLIEQGLDPHLKNRAGISPIDIANADDNPAFGKQMQRQRAAYLMKQEELVRLKAIEEQRIKDETLREITETVRTGVHRAIRAPEKASFKHKS